MKKIGQYSILLEMFLLLGNFISINAQPCHYLKGLSIIYKMNSSVISTKENAILTIIYENHSSDVAQVYDTLIEGDTYSLYTNVQIALKKKKEGKYIPYIPSVYCPIGALDSADHNLLTTVFINPMQTKVLKYDVLRYTKYLEKGEYSLQIDFRKIPASGVCQKKFERKNIFFKVTEVLSDNSLMERDGASQINIKM